MSTHDRHGHGYGRSGYYDDENGLCVDDRYYDDYDEELTPESLAERCAIDTPFGDFYSPECMQNEIIRDVAERIWEGITGDSN